VKTRLAILLWAANPSNAHLCATPFFHAAVAAAMDTEVEMYFTNASVRLLGKGVAAALPSGPRRRDTVYAFMQRAAAQGTKFYACSQAMEEYAVAESDWIPEVTGAAGAAAYIARCLDDAWVTITY
jgi:predicted peroxiredoxin